MIDANKFIKSFFQILPWIKNIRFIAGAVIIGFVVFTVYRAYFMPTSKTKVIAQKGSHIVIQQSKEKKSHWPPTLVPFVEGDVFTDSNNRSGVGARAGIKVEF